MLFIYTWQQVLDGTKTATRRLVKPGDALRLEPNKPAAVTGEDRLRWEVGRTYSVQPGQYKKGVGQIRVTGLRREPLQAMTEADAILEGELPPDPAAGRSDSALDRFRARWDSTHEPGAQFASNPDVWVITFELVS